MLSDMSRLQRISVLAWRVLLGFEWPKETIWKAVPLEKRERGKKTQIERGY